MRLIDADALKTKKRHSTEFHENVVAVAEIDWMPTVDAVQVVRCKDCKHYRKIEDNSGICVVLARVEQMTDDFFCADGERKEGECGED